jgi:PAS domain S-box-containing protein
MTDTDDLPSEDMQNLLQFIYMCPVGLVAFDDDGVVSHVNPGAVNLLASTLAVTDVSNIFTVLADTWPDLERRVRDFGRSSGLIVEGHRVGSNAPRRTTRWLSFTVNRVAAGHNSMAIADATSAVETEAELRTSEARLRTLFNAIDEGYCLCEILVDDRGLPCDYRFLEVNPLFEEMTGLADPVGRTAHELVPDLEREWVEAYGRVALDGETLRFEQGSGTMGRWFNVFSVPVEPLGHFAIVFKDETARHLVETALKESEYRFRTMADQLPLLVWTSDLEGRPEWVNRSFVEFFGVEPELVGPDLDWWGPVHPDDREPNAREMNAAIDEQRAFRMELWVRRADGESRWVELIAEPRFSQMGAFLGHLGMTQDVTERKAATETLAREAKLAAKRIERAEFVADVLADLETQSTLENQLAALTSLLVPRIGDYVSIEAPGNEFPLVVWHRDPDKVEILRTMRTDRRRINGRATSSRRAAAGESLLLAEMTPDVVRSFLLNPQQQAMFDQLAPRSHITVPLDLGAGVYGSLAVGLVDPDRPVYSPDDLAFVREAAQRIGVVLAATRLRHEEHDISVRLQRALLPDTVAWHPNLLIAARYQAASDFMDVGGDWYDTFTWPTGEIGIFIGDVVGHNLESAATMGRLRAATAALATYVEPSPRVLLEALDKFANGPDGTEFATATCVVIDPASGRLTYSSAGHPLVLVVSPGGSSQFLSGASGLPICALANGARPEASIDLEPGAFLVMYSDGLVERRRSRIDDELARLAQLAVDSSALHVDDIADTLIESMVDATHLEDDVVVACCRYAPPIATFEKRIPARADQLAVVRAEIRAWLAERGIESGDVLIALGEACSNAVEHAYPEGVDGDIALSLSDHRHRLSAQVRDFGIWRAINPGQSHGGRGLSIMNALSWRFERSSGPTGTVISMVLPRVALSTTN